MNPITIGLGLAKVVPAIAKWIGGDKAEQTTQKVIDIAKVVTDTNSGADALAAIQQDPALALQFETAVMQHEAELELLANEDRKDSRARDVRLRELIGNNWRADFLAIGAFMALTALIAALLFIKLDEGTTRDVLLVLSGTLVAIVKDVYQFEFGSSRGSKDKDLKRGVGS